MGTTRKLKRRLLKEWAKEGKKPAEQVAKVAAKEVDETRDAAARFGFDIIGAAVLAMMLDYGKLKDRSTRLTNAIQLINKRFRTLRGGELSPKERETFESFSLAFAEHWVNVDEEDREHAAD